jgi:MFS transporter, NNP family, nitrate/nitrite transporter
MVSQPRIKFLLTIVPTLVGSVLRLPYTFAVAKFGGRHWTVFSALLLLVPMALALGVLKPGVSLDTLLVVAAFAGVGGGNFGVPVVQLVGLLVLATAGATHPRVLIVSYIPLILLSAFGAWRNMDNLSSAKNDKRAMRDVLLDAHTWVVSLLYIGTFGSFIGFGFAFGQVLQVQFKADFPTALDAAYLTFLGPLLGSLIRPVGGTLADRIGGARVTCAPSSRWRPERRWSSWRRCRRACRSTWSDSSCCSC